MTADTKPAPGRGELKLLRQQIEYLTGVPSEPGVLNDYRAPEIDAAVLRCRERGDDETAQILARMRLAYRQQTDALTSELATVKKRLESADRIMREVALEAHETIPPDGKQAAFVALHSIGRIVSGYFSVLQEQEKQNG